MNWHTRPFQCSVKGCARTTRGFATKDGLKRHNEAHKRRNGEDTSDLLFCSVSGCPRTNKLEGGGFSRKYQLREHMRRAHSGTTLPSSLAPRTANVSKTSSLTESFTASPESINQSLANPDLRKRKRTPASNLGIQEASKDEDVSVQNDSKKVKLGDKTILILDR